MEAPYMDEAEENLETMNFKRSKTLNFNAPFLSTKRIGYSGDANTSCSSNTLGAVKNTSVPFSWEQAPGKPKNMETRNSTCDGDTPRLTLPPCLWHPTKKAAEADIYNGVLTFDQDDGCDGDDEDDKNGVFSDAMDILSLLDASDIMQQSDRAQSEVNDGLRLKLGESNGDQSPTYMINRFLPDANALAASSAVHCSNDFAGSTRKSCASSPRGCGLEFVFSWLMKNKLCTIKSPVLPSSTNIQKHGYSSKHKETSLISS